MLVRFLPVVLFLPAAIAAPVDYARDVQPIFREHCYSCHGPTVQQGRFRLDRRSSAMRGGSIAVIAPGTASGSRLFHKITSKKYGPQMPPAGPLSAENIAIIQQWLDQGAPWPDALSNHTPPPPPDPAAVRLMAALRAGRTPATLDGVKAKGANGNTPLHFAAFYAAPAVVGQLLAAGADPNAANDDGATPLHWAAANRESVKLLLDAGANPNARSADGHTPLSIGAARRGGAPVVELLLARGAQPSASDRHPLSGAALHGDPESLRLLLAASPDRKTTPLATALVNGCQPCFDVLFPASTKADRTAALRNAAARGNRAAYTRLLDGGAEPPADILQAVSVPEQPDPEFVRAVLARGAKADGASLDLALRHGESPVTKLLRDAGATAKPLPAPPAAKPAPAPSARAAFDRAFPLLKHTDDVFLRQSGCVSCHHNSLFAMTIEAARKAGRPVDVTPLEAQRKIIGPYIESWRERALQGMPIPGAQDTMSYLLLGLAAGGYPADAATDAMAYYLKGVQRPDGSWRAGFPRAPIESSDFEVTAAAIRSLAAFAPAPHRAEYKAAIDRAAQWLGTAPVLSNEDAVFRVLGLLWAGAPAKQLAPFATALRARQNADGGWSQLPTLPSDAYATGQAIYALCQARAAVPKNGVQFLLNTQYADGSWYVRSRATPFQPYFETGFPYGDHQWISTAATNWAAMALSVR